MTRRALGLSMALVIAAGGCGGGPSAQRRESTPAASSVPREEVRSLAEILGPLGAHRTPEQLAEIAAFIHRWEQDPLAPMPENTSEHSTAFLMLAWLTESPDVTVIVTTALSHLSTGRGADVGSIATMGSTFGMAAYLATHPGADGHDPDVQAAGVASALHWYEASLRRGGERNELFDELITVRDQHGIAGLRDWWTDRVSFPE